MLPQKEAGLRLPEEEEINREVGVAEEEKEVIAAELVLTGTTVHTKTESTKAKEAAMKQGEIDGLEQNHIDPSLRTEGKGCKYRGKEGSGAH